MIAVADRNAARARRFADHHGLTADESPSALLADERTDLVVNLTNPRRHVGATTTASEAGKHVYAEKPLAMDPTAAVQLVEPAGSKNLQLSAAPCSPLGKSAQTLWKAIRDKRVGTIRLVYARGGRWARPSDALSALD